LVAALVAVLLSACHGSLPALTHAPGEVAIEANRFTPSTVTIARGGTLTFVSESQYALHILVIGTDARSQPEPGAPDLGGSGGHRSEPASRWTSPTWATAGVFHVTCTIHPAMNLTVSVAVP
jgi:plastocyanin